MEDFFKDAFWKLLQPFFDVISARGFVFESKLGWILALPVEAAFRGDDVKLTALAHSDRSSFVFVAIWFGLKFIWTCSARGWYSEFLEI